MAEILEDLRKNNNKNPRRQREKGVGGDRGNVLFS